MHVIRQTDVLHHHFRRRLVAWRYDDVENAATLLSRHVDELLETERCKYLCDPAGVRVFGTFKMDVDIPCLCDWCPVSCQSLEQLGQLVEECYAYRLRSRIYRG